jgi:hypothetical protein
MATIDTSILDAALEDKLFSRRLTSNQKRYLALSVITAWNIIQAIDDRLDDGIDVAALSQCVGIHPNTIKIYCRWLRSAGLIDYENRPNAVGSALVYFSKKSYLTRSKQ